MYELHSEGFARFLLAPHTGLQGVLTIVLGMLFGLATILAVQGEVTWMLAALLVVFPLYVAAICWRLTRTSLTADASGISVQNILRRYRLGWNEVTAISTSSGTWNDWGPSTVDVDRTRGRLWTVPVHASFGIGRVRRREVTLELGVLARASGYGFPVGDEADLEAMWKARVIDVTDPAIHEEWWRARYANIDA